MNKISLLAVPLMVLVILPLGTSAYGISGSFETPSGITYNYSDFSGNWLLVEVFASFCHYCAAFHPTLTQIYENYGSEINIVSVSSWSGESMEKIDTFTDEHPTYWPIGIDREFGPAHGVSATPTTILFDKDGVEVQRWEGNQPYENFAEYLDAILAGTTLDTSYSLNDKPSESVLGSFFGNPLVQLGTATGLILIIYFKSTSKKVA